MRKGVTIWTAKGVFNLFGEIGLRDFKRVGCAARANYGCYCRIAARSCFLWGWLHHDYSLEGYAIWLNAVAAFGLKWHEALVHIADNVLSFFHP
ncbi:hypothetical protein [Photobacterium indicum]|uniref:hypothetical protein n=1 Tax=Photobacterium indicum TaxID=81447 RepID=UPI003D0B4F4C